MTRDPEAIEVLCRYRVKPDKVQEFADLLRRHWPTLHDAGLTTDTPAELEKARTKAGDVAFFERFTWLTPDAVQSAHENPAVMKLWEPLGALCTDMEFWQVEDFHG